MHPAGSRSRRGCSVADRLGRCRGAPLGLIWVARRRFGSGAVGRVDPPWRWDGATIRDALDGPLTESVIVDVIIRIAAPPRGSRSQ